MSRHDRILRVGLVAALALVTACRRDGAVAPTPPKHDVRVTDRDAVQQVLKSYFDRIAADDRSGAVALIDRQTFRFYEELRRDAVSLSASELKGRPLRDQIVVIMFRQGKTAAALRTHPIATLVAASIQPLIDPRALRVKEVHIDGDRATVHVSFGDLEGTLPLELRRDPEGWRLNFIAATRLAADRLIDGDDPEEVLAFLAKYYGVDVETLYALPR